MADNVELTAEQTEKLIQFQDLSGIEEIRRCQEILQQHNWDIEVAVQDTFNEREGAPSVFNEPPPPAEPRQPTMNLQPPDQRVFTVARRPPQGFFQWSYYVVMFPFRFAYTSILDILKFVFRLIRPDPRRNVTDPVGDVERFLAKYNELYGDEHPAFYRGSYSQALNDAKRELRFLLVYLHGDDHQDTHSFCRNTLGNPDVRDFINGRVLFWACNTNSPEGYRVSRALRENTYPFLALVVLRQNKMTVVARIEGPVDGQELTEKLERVMTDNETSLIAARAEREERNFTQTLRREQDEAYLESLRADQEKERTRRGDLEKLEQEKQKVVDAEMERQRMLEERELRKEDLRNSIPPEPAADHPDRVQIVLKLPHGDRVQRRFLKSDSLKHLYHFAFCHEQCPDDFHIVTNFPRRTLPCEPTEEVPEPPSFGEVGLGKMEMLFIQDNEA
ncbi:FAS-associated factor 2-like [Mizuhopecten yessoensis]|uniref:FAS-associated factor 2 n=1 Tax=Mizuhopecten yessoensis TaxID=6573 RepID=A0A210QMY2_MIZYE|nr:FAS-associated factor 2-like [Mizuhopecten yessoensis]OWF50061.1 FAS-associated factor 2 [Mizuhopecten yessoensis]